MAVYFIIFFLNLIFCVIGYHYKWLDKAGAFIMTMIMFLLCGLRSVECGTDTINYYHIFSYNAQFNEQRLEPLFILLRNSISEFQIFLIIFAFGTYAILYYVVQKEVRYCSIAILIFMISTTKFFPESFNIIRQSLAASIILWGFTEWNKNRISNKIKTLILFVIATLFHYSSFVAFLFLIVGNVKFNKTVTYIIIIVTLILGIFGITRNIVQNFIVHIGESNINSLVTHYVNYGYRVDNLMHFSSLILWLIPLSYFAITCYPITKMARMKYGYYYNVFFIATIVGNLLIPALDWGLRLIFSVMIIQVIVIPDAIRYAARKQRFLIFSAIMLCSISYLFYIYHLQYNIVTSIVPYESII